MVKFIGVIDNNVNLYEDPYMDDDKVLKCRKQDSDKIYIDVRHFFLKEECNKIENLDSSEWIRVNNPKSWKLFTVIMVIKNEFKYLTYKRICSENGYIWKYQYPESGDYINTKYSEELEDLYNKSLREKKLKRICNEL